MLQCIVSSPTHTDCKRYHFRDFGVLGLNPIPVNEIDRNPETLVLQGIQVFGSHGNY